MPAAIAFVIVPALFLAIPAALLLVALAFVVAAPAFAQEPPPPSADLHRGRRPARRRISPAS
ncbi:MAG: hypothetical protein HYX51_01675 [Chloroflexi bacterium]|nr:hypothetical protein [Chloroflexota bacterium]